MAILAIAERNNAALMHECAMLGYLDGLVLDMTYGLGAFWARWAPSSLITMDRHTAGPEAKGCMMKADALALPFPDACMDAVVFDPPYKLNGTSTGVGPSALDDRYGVGSGYVPIRARHRLLLDGTTEACRVSRGYVLVKCADQISSGRYQAQSFLVWERAIAAGATVVDHLLVPGMREQPLGTRQLHSRRNYSSLLVFAVKQKGR